MRRAMLTLGVLAVFTGLAAAAPVPKSIKAKKVRKTIEPRPGEKLYSVEWVDVPCEKAMDELEKLTGLLYLSKDTPKLKITLKADGVCVSELFALVNDELEPRGYVLGRKSQSFSVFKTDAPLDLRFCRPVTEKELDRQSQEEPVQIILPAFDQEGVDQGLKVAEGITHKWFKAESFGPDKLLVVGRAADVRKFVDDMPPPPSREEQVEKILRKKGLK